MQVRIVANFSLVITSLVANYNNYVIVRSGGLIIITFLSYQDLKRADRKGKGPNVGVRAFSAHTLFKLCRRMSKGQI